MLAPPSPELTGGAPATFGGRDDWWSPEHLLLASLGLCLKTTFEALGARATLEVMDYRAKLQATLDKSAQGLTFTLVRADVQVRVAPHEIERARQVLEQAQRACLISNALRVPVEVHAVVTSP
jgi:organic hydroperoxide reductase OsmC/OhrA